MCGILGWVGADSVTEESRARVNVALETLRGRGPNGKQTEAGSDWILGHTRLKILDLTERATQPMRDNAGRWLVFNGEIYNFRELRKELEAHGHQFRSTGDTEVLLEALARWGSNAIEKLHGMFAFGWLDPERRELLLARDRFGVKPLVWERTADGLRFASDLFALDAMAGGGREIDPESARDYLMLGYVPAPRCIWNGPRKVMPGSYVRIRWRTGSAVEVIESNYWSFKQVPPAGTGKNSAATSEFPEKLRAAVRSRLVSDVPVGLLLSGGIDSSSVAAACAELPDNEANVPAYTMGFADQDSDERVYAKEVAETLGIKHEEFLAEETDIAALFDRVWTAFDEPFADSSALPMLELCREIGRRVTVAIGGDGGDEVWCGYPWHRALYRAERLSWVPRVGRRLAARLMPFQNRKWRYYGAVLAASDRLEAWATLKTSLTPATARFLPIDAEPLAPKKCFECAAANLTDICDPLDWAGRMDLMTYLPDDLMVKADRASMKVGLELREPLLEYDFVEWGLALPTEERFDYTMRLGKQPARHYLASRVPADILERQKKGFTPPLRRWLDGPLRDRWVQALDELSSGDLAPLILPSACRDWDECSELLCDTHQQFLWRIVCFSGWKGARTDALRSSLQTQQLSRS
jgi:asparagine synthase (glutamine-hydrolysing)